MTRCCVLVVLLAAPALASERIQLGAGAGLLVAPTFLGSTPVFVGGLASFELEVPLGASLGLRVSPMLGGGAAPAVADPRLGGSGRTGPALGLGALLVDTQLRLRFSPSVSAGVGALVGVAFGGVAQGAALGFWFGPSLTLVALRLGERHEVSAWVGLAFLPGSAGVGLGALLPAVRYAFFF